jgi:hypothetical protein
LGRGGTRYREVVWMSIAFNVDDQLQFFARVCSELHILSFERARALVESDAAIGMARFCQWRWVVEAAFRDTALNATVADGICMVALGLVQSTGLTRRRLAIAPAGVHSFTEFRGGC